MAKRRTTKRRRATTDAEQSAPVAPDVESGTTTAPTEDSYAVFRWAGRGMYVGSLVSSRGIPRHATVSLPPHSFRRAIEDGLEFVRWAGINGPSLEL